MGLVWGAGGVFAGGMIELIWNVFPGFPLGPAVDIWPAVLGVIGFFAGASFSVVLAVAGRRRRFDELSLPRFTAWGALSGLLLGGAYVALATTLGGANPFSRGAATVIGVATLGSAIGAAKTLTFARIAERRELRAARTEVEDVGLSGGEEEELLGR